MFIADLLGGGLNTRIPCALSYLILKMQGGK